MTVSHDPRTLEVKSVDGKIVATADVPNLLKEKTKVIVSPNGKPVSDQMVIENKNTVIILVKPAKYSSFSLPCQRSANEPLNELGKLDLERSQPID